MWPKATTGVVASRLGRGFVLVDLKFQEMQRVRLAAGSRELIFEMENEL